MKGFKLGMAIGLGISVGTALAALATQILLLAVRMALYYLGVGV